MPKRLLLNAIVPALAAACVVGAPPGFSSGDRWSAPLAAPLEGGPALVPVSINGKGPFLFMIDPDSDVSSIEERIAAALDLYTVQAGDVADESDTMRTVRTAEVREITVGTLKVANRVVRLHRNGSFGFNGRPIDGLLGRDVVSDSLILHIDRDRGQMILATQGHLDPPPDAVSAPLRRFNDRFLARARIGGEEVEMYLDFAAPASLLWPEVMQKLGLRRARVRATLVDHLGTARQVDFGGIAPTLAVGDAAVDNHLILPFGDRRFRPQDYDGALGENFLSRFLVTVNWHKKRVYLKARQADLGALASERLGRWGATMAKCKTPACVTVSIERPGAPAPPAGGVRGGAPAPPAPGSAGSAAPAPPAPGSGEPTSGGEATAAADGAATAPAAASPPAGAPPPAGPIALVATREPWTRDLTYEVVLEALNPDGSPIGLPLLLVTFPKGAETITARAGIAPYAAAASFRVVDMSPFPRPCDEGGGVRRCVWPIRPLR